MRKLKIFRLESGGPFDPMKYGNGMHVFADPGDAGGTWQPNEVKYPSYEADKKTTVRSWYDGPGYSVQPTGGNQEWSEGAGQDWWFYVEIWRYCKGGKGSGIVDRAHFQIGLEVRNTGGEIPVEARLHVRGPIWVNPK